MAFCNEKLADLTSSSIKIYVGKQPSGGNKLRTYKLIKTKYSIEPYLLCVANRGKGNSCQNLNAATIRWPSKQALTQENSS